MGCDYMTNVYKVTKSNIFGGTSDCASDFDIENPKFSLELGRLKTTVEYEWDAAYWFWRLIKLQIKLILGKESFSSNLNFINGWLMRTQLHIFLNKFWIKMYKISCTIYCSF